MGAIHLAPRSCGVLSGGERQRVLSLVADLAHDLHRTIVVVLHDLNLAARYCDDLVLLDGGGRIAPAGPVCEVIVPAYSGRSTASASSAFRPAVTCSCSSAL